MPGPTLAHYEILALLGRGGMGEVHRALDTKLGREVALKLLPEDFARDPERLARFRREAKVLASLQHTNIAGVFGLEEAEQRVFLVMELAEGADLSQRIAQGPVPEEEALDIARQLAAGLEEAHEQGVVHRDLKPANIKLGSDGKVKILDFGLARVFAGETAEEESLENSPTITAAMSQGVILGTAAYMSPEQARGRKVDRRTDIWAFGVVLFEILTGKRLFEGETISDTLAAVLRADIEWDQLPGDTSPGIRRLLERCLERDPLRRLRDIGEARVFLEDGAQDSALLASASSVISGSYGDLDASTGRSGIPLWATIAIAAALAVLGTGLGWKVLGRSQPRPVFNTALPVPASHTFRLDSTRPGPAVISPDGTMVVYSVRDESRRTSLHLRRLDRPQGVALSGTDSAAYPFWSPDSRHVGFSTNDGKLKKVPVSGGPPVTLCAAENMKGGTWSEDGTILFTPDHESGIYRVSDAGGEPVEITTINEAEGEDSHRHPRFLPGGEQFLFMARVESTAESENRVYLASLNGEAARFITTSETAAEYSDGHLLTVREGVLFATPFDPDSGELGEGVPLVEEILVLEGAACGVYSATFDGMLVYQVSTGETERMLEWLGAADAQLGKIGEPGEIYRPRISPDGAQAVIEILDPDTETSDLWLVDLESGLRSRFTFDPGDEAGANWTPDGQSILYTARADSIFRIMARPVEGTGGAAILYETDRGIGVTDLSPDGATLMINERDPDTDWNLYSMVDGMSELEPRVVTDAIDFGGVISPDGRWLAYCTGGAAGWDIFVRPMSGGDRRWQVNRGNGLYPFWSPDGKRLFYLESSGTIAAVPVDGSGSTFRAGAPQPFVNVAPPSAGGLHVSIHPDGEKILHVAGAVSEDESGYLSLVTDWRRGLAN